MKILVLSPQCLILVLLDDWAEYPSYQLSCCLPRDSRQLISRFPVTSNQDKLDAESSAAIF
jgi:hypothetical protein